MARSEVGGVSGHFATYAIKWAALNLKRSFATRTLRRPGIDMSDAGRASAVRLEPGVARRSQASVSWHNFGSSGRAGAARVTEIERERIPILSSARSDRKMEMDTSLTQNPAITPRMTLFQHNFQHVELCWNVSNITSCWKLCWNIFNIISCWKYMLEDFQHDLMLELCWNIFNTDSCGNICWKFFQHNVVLEIMLEYFQHDLMLDIMLEYFQHDLVVEIDVGRFPTSKKTTLPE